MSFTYIRDIPFASHNPSNDVPNMQTNTNSIDNLLQVDHVSFNDVTNSGKHIHITFPTSQSDPVLLNNQAQLYPKTFGTGATYLETYTASSTSGGSQINGYLPFVKAMARFTAVGGPYPQVLPNSIADTLFTNIASIVQNPAGTVTITFTIPLPYTTYYVFSEVGTAIFTSVTKNTTTVVFTLQNATSTYGFMVI